MTSKIKRSVKAALTEGDLNRAVKLLKRGLRKDHYWAWGHRVLGDIYFEEIDHTSYALVQYRKLKEAVDNWENSDRLRLALAYCERDFHDKAAGVLEELNEDDLSGTFKILDSEYVVEDLYNQLLKSTNTRFEENEESYFEKYKKKGDEHRKHANYFEAQQAYEKALDFMEDQNVKYHLSRCLIKRSKFPRALKLLKELKANDEFDEDVEELLNQVYERLGLNELFSDVKTDDDDESGRSRKVS